MTVRTLRGHQEAPVLADVEGVVQIDGDGEAAVNPAPVDAAGRPHPRLPPGWLIPEDGNTLSHVWVNNGALIERMDLVQWVTWPAGGELSFVPKTPLGFPNEREAEGFTNATARVPRTTTIANALDSEGDYFVTAIATLGPGFAGGGGLYGGGWWGPNFEILQWNRNAGEVAVTLIWTQNGVPVQRAFSLPIGATGIVASFDRSATGKGGAGPTGCFVWMKLNDLPVQGPIDTNIFMPIDTFRPSYLAARTAGDAAVNPEGPLTQSNPPLATGPIFHEFRFQQGAPNAAILDALHAAIMGT